MIKNPAASTSAALKRRPRWPPKEAVVPVGERPQRETGAPAESECEAVWTCPAKRGCWGCRTGLWGPLIRGTASPHFQRPGLRGIVGQLADARRAQDGLCPLNPFPKCHCFVLSSQDGALAVGCTLFAVKSGWWVSPSRQGSQMAIL